MIDISRQKVEQKWICGQLGAREHYAIPRTLNRSDKLSYLITDGWIPSHSLINLLPHSPLDGLKERFHCDLEEASVHAFTLSLLQFEVNQKLKKQQGWNLIIARNQWFQQKTVKFLKSITSKFSSNKPILFAYSYAALEIFRYGKSQGWQTILGQIDPGLVEEKLVLREHQKRANYQASWQSAPTEYWINWQEECSLADRIIVNSNWSSQALQQVGIPSEKIEIVPLAYQPSDATQNFERVYPSQFSSQRPLRVLFLGQVILRKGIAALLESAKLLENQPIEFFIVGSLGITIPDDIPPNVNFLGSVPRGAVAKHYQWSDVFLFPTLSDGFGLTQLEAQAWKLPIIASKFCGEVVKHQVNGLLLEEVTGEAITEALNFCLNNPRKLDNFSNQSSQLEDFGLTQLNLNLQRIANEV